MHACSLKAKRATRDASPSSTAVHPVVAPPGTPSGWACPRASPVPAATAGAYPGVAEEPHRVLLVGATGTFPAVVTASAQAPALGSSRSTRLPLRLAHAPLGRGCADHLHGRPHRRGRQGGQ